MKSLSAALSVVALLPEPLAANATLIDPVPYSLFAASPSARALFDYSELEHLEDCLFHASEGLAAQEIAPRSTSMRDWVDADSLASGSGNSGYTWYFNGVSSITFTFSAALLGALPNHAGLIWTDAGLANVREGSDSILFEAFDTANNLLGIIGPSALGDGLFAGQTAKDRFFGITSASGIESVRISLLHSTEQGVDKLQYDLTNFTPFSTDPDLAATLAVLVVGRAGDGFTRRHLHD